MRFFLYRVDQWNCYYHADLATANDHPYEPRDY